MSILLHTITVIQYSTYDRMWSNTKYKAIRYALLSQKTFCLGYKTIYYTTILNHCGGRWMRMGMKRKMWEERRLRINSPLSHTSQWYNILYSSTIEYGKIRHTVHFVVTKEMLLWMKPWLYSRPIIPVGLQYNVICNTIQYEAMHSNPLAVSPPLLRQTKMKMRMKM